MEHILPQCRQEEPALLTPYFGVFVLQNCETMNLRNSSCLKPPNVWWYNADYVSIVCTSRLCQDKPEQVLSASRVLKSSVGTHCCHRGCPPHTPGISWLSSTPLPVMQSGLGSQFPKAGVYHLHAALSHKATPHSSTGHFSWRGSDSMPPTSTPFSSSRIHVGPGCSL